MDIADVNEEICKKHNYFSFKKLFYVMCFVVGFFGCGFFLINSPGQQLTEANHLLVLSRCCPQMLQE